MTSRQYGRASCRSSRRTCAPLNEGQVERGSGRPTRLLAPASGARTTLVADDVFFVEATGYRAGSVVHAKRGRRDNHSASAVRLALWGSSAAPYLLLTITFISITVQRHEPDRDSDCRCDGSCSGRNGWVRNR